jgi:hypothetical protein
VPAKKEEGIMSFRNMFLAAMVSSVLAIPGFAQDQTQVNIDPFFATLDVNEDGAIDKGEWQDMGLKDFSFPLCDPNEDNKVAKQEMSDCAVAEVMDPKNEGVLTIYAGGRFVIQSPGNPIPKPANAPPGITRATQFVADSPYVEGGPTGQDFITMFDADGDGKVGHMEWEKVKGDTVFKPFRWPQYNKNRDEWITVDEAPKVPEKE